MHVELTAGTSKLGGYEMEDYKLNRRKFIGMTALAGAALASPAYILVEKLIFGPITILFHKVSKNSLKQKPVSKLISA